MPHPHSGAWLAWLGRLAAAALLLAARPLAAALPALDLQRVLEHGVDGRRVTGVQVCVQQGGERWCGAAGTLGLEQPFYIASTTKLFTAALLLILEEEGRLELDAPLESLLPDSLWSSLHVWKGEDYSGRLTPRHLLSQTSGLADYFEETPAGGTSFKDGLLTGTDRAWTPVEALQRARELGARFAPGTPGKAYYSDTNYQLLGLVIEEVTGQSYAQALESRLFTPLGLRHTWLWKGATPASQSEPAALRAGDEDMPIPQAMASFGPDGGIVSTADELLVFLRAFFGGTLFPAARLPELQHWRPIFFPFDYGTGLMRFQVPRLFSPFKRFPALVGHSGLSGAFAFYCPEQDLYLCGTVNQIQRPGTSFRLMLRLQQELQAARRQQEP